MAATKSRTGRSEGFYKSLDELSTASFMPVSTKRLGRFFEVDRVVSTRTIKGKKEFLVKWKGYGHLSDSWEPEDNLNDHALRSFIDPKPSSERLKDGTEALALGILQHTKAKQGHADAPTTIEMRNDVFIYLFKGKGKQSGRRGHIELEKNDFSRCQFPDGWDTYIDKLGDGHKVIFPIRVRKFLSWGPKTYHLVNGSVAPKPRYCQEKVSICFSTSAHSIS